MGPPRSTPHSARPSRSPSPTSGPHLPPQTLINTPATTTTSTPQQGLATDLVVGGGSASARDPRANAGSPQNVSQPVQSSPLLQLSTAPPHPPSAQVASPTSTLPPSSFRFSSGARLTRAQSRSFGSLETTTPPPDQRSQREFGSTSSLDTTGSSSAIHRPTRGRGSLSDLPFRELSVASGTSRGNRSAVRGVGRDAVASSRRSGMSEDEEEDEDEHYSHHGGAHASGASDADSEGSTRRRRSQADQGQPGPRERLLLPTTELELFHAKKKRTRVLPTAHQSAELNKLLAETPFPSTARREELGRRIGLSARKVQVWFQNRRQKARREKEEAAMKQQSASTSTSVSGRPESPSLAPLSPRQGQSYSMRMAAMPHPPSAWSHPPAPGAGTGYPPRSEYTLQPATAHSGHVMPGTSPYQLRPVDVPPDSVAEYGMVPVYRRHSPRAQSWSGGDPRDPVLGPSPHLGFTREHQRSSTHAEIERFTSVDRSYGRPASPPSSFHPYTTSAEARRRRSPSRRIVQSRPPSPRGVQSRPASPFDGQSVAASEALTQDVRLPPLNLPPGSPASPLLGPHEPRGSLDRVPLSPPYPQSVSRAASASTSLDRRIGDAASQQQQVAPAARPAEVAQSASHSTAYPPPFTLQPEPLWDRHAVPDYFQPRRLSWPSQIALRPPPSHTAPGPSEPQQPIRLPWPVSGPSEAAAGGYPSRPSSPRPRR